MDQIWSWFLDEVCVKAVCGVRTAALLCLQACPAVGWLRDSSSSLHPPFPSRKLLLRDAAGSGHPQEESGITLLPLSPADLVKYLKTAGPGLGLEERL